MTKVRDSRGYFVKGHGGQKPRGAISKSDRERRSRIEYVLSLIEENIEEEIRSLTPKEKVELWLHLIRHIYAKPARIKQSGPAIENQFNKIIFQVVSSKQE
jgi:hypothetical protein